MEQIYEIIGSLLGALVVGLLAYLTPKVKAWLEENADKTAQEVVLALVRSFCRAAEQLLKAEDPTGEQRKQYVIEQLRLLGVEITEAVLSMIEGEVWGINTETKRAQVLPVALGGLVIEDTVEVEEAGHGDGQ